MRPDGNVAFKLTWVYGTQGPFTSACTDDGRRTNIKLAHHVWCSQPENKCFKALEAVEPGQVKVDDDSYPCNDVMAFRWWAFSSGWFHHGDRRGRPIPMRFVNPGKLAFLTSRRHDMTEEQRVVLGCFRVSEVCEDDAGGLWAHSEPGPDRIWVRDQERAPRYWEFHRQASGPSWGTGLFRYVPDSEAERLYAALHKAAGK